METRPVFTDYDCDFRFTVTGTVVRFTVTDTDVRFPALDQGRRLVAPNQLEDMRCNTIDHLGKARVQICEI